MGAQENNHEEVNGEVKPLNGVITNDYEVDKDSNKGNEEKKIFCGGISYETTSDDLVNYFNQFGEVLNAQVKFDRNTGRSRGFAFVEFATAEACKLALAQREQNIKSKQCEIKPAKTRESNLAVRSTDELNKKVFVGGLPSDFPEEDLRKHFEQFGKVEDVEWPFDKQTKSRRNFAFVVFEEEEGADRASSTTKQMFGSREVSCDVKKAVPQNKRNRIFPGAHMALRGAFGGQGFRGPPLMPNANSWLQPWGQMSAGMHHAAAYPTAATNATANAWNDWYATQAAAAYYAHGGASNGAPTGNYHNYHPHHMNPQAGYHHQQHKQLAEKMANLAVGVPNGYDYSAAAAAHQGATGGGAMGQGAGMGQRQPHGGHQNGNSTIGVSNGGANGAMARYPQQY